MKPLETGTSPKRPLNQVLPPPSKPFWLPPPQTAVKLMATGATVGTLVDSLHNQVLLEYHVAPLQVPSLIHPGALWVASSWTVPPLLAFAYLVLGSILPRVVQKLIQSVAPHTKLSGTGEGIGTVDVSSHTISSNSPRTINSPSLTTLRQRALWAVTTTAAIVKLSDILERHPDFTFAAAAAGSNINALDLQHLIILFTAAFLQWWALDRTPTAFVCAALTAYVGPLAELPFVTAHVWTYLPDAAHYLPLQGDGLVAQIFRTLLPQANDNLAISYLSAPCYFAVTMDAIALGRWFQEP